MRRAVLALVLTAVGIIAMLSYKTRPLTAPLGAARLPTTPTPAGGGASPTPSASSSTGGAPAGASAAPSAAGAASRTYDGSVAQTPFGPVQLRITVAGGKVTAITPLQLPQGTGYDMQVDQIAVPQLTQEALAAQSANISAISGATYTSNGYATSLQAALSAAHL